MADKSSVKNISIYENRKEIMDKLKNMSDDEVWDLLHKIKTKENQ